MNHDHATLPKRQLRTLHLFAGAGGGILADLLLGHRPIGAVEIEEYPRKVLLQRQRDGILPRFPIWDDVQTFDGKPWRGRVDIVCGGFPCQDISCAGKGEGIYGERSGMWSEMARIICEIRPKHVLVENSPMLTSRGLGVVLGDLASMGYDARWGVLGAADIGAPHKRDRIWIMANMREDGRNNEADAQPSGSDTKGRTAWPWWGMSKLARLRSVRLDSEGDQWANDPCETESGMVRVVDGVAHQVDRLSAIGNGQVPQVAALAWRILTNELQ